MPLGFYKAIGGIGRRRAPVPAAGPLFGAGSAKPIFGIETTSGVGSPFNFKVPAETISGDLILILSSARDDRNVTFPSGFTELRDVKNGGLAAAHIGYKISNGSEAGQTFGMIPNSGGGFTNTVLTIRGGGIPAVSANYLATTNSPSTFNVTGASGNTLFISFAGARNINAVSLNAPPSGMSTIKFHWQNGAFNAIAGLYSTATSYNPPAWSLSASTASVIVGWTIRV